MHKLKTTIRTAALYISSVVVIGSVPMAAFADSSPACVDDYLTGSQWGTSTKTGKCILLYDRKGRYIGPAYMAPDPAPVSSPAPDSSSLPDSSVASASPVASDTTITDSGDNNSTAVDSTNTDTSNTTDNNVATVNNGITSTAQSGNAGVSGNESKGSATSGDTTTQATVVNNVNSVNGNSGVTTFTYDVNGNVVGDITINGNNGPVDINNTNSLSASETVNNNTSLTNDVDLNSTSGNASVTGNESKGDATSGTANTVANIINLINTIIAANQSFVGTINIYGNLNGDILLSPEFIPQLLASNNGSNSSLNNTNTLTSTTNINDTASIVNNIQLNAQSGDASVSGNQSNGNATSGLAQTNLTILNLTGHQVTAANSLLIFVNVLGTWVGMIVDAPGATAAAFGSGVTENNTNTLTANANLSNNTAITNNVNLTSQTGNATVTGNESKGSATSGNATASANIANLDTSNFDLSGWFGILFVNVFGSWNGSFGVNTPAGNPTPPPSNPGQGGSDGAGVQATSSDAGAMTSSPTVQFGFIPGGSGSSQNQPSGFAAIASDSDSSGMGGTAVLAAATHVSDQAQSVVPVTGPRVDQFTPILMIGGFGVAGISGAWMLIRRRVEMRTAANI